MAGRTTWTAERTERAQKLWREGISASAIAKRLGDVTRNGVIGRMHRTLGKKDNESASRARAMSGRMKARDGRKPRGPKPKPIDWHAAQRELAGPTVNADPDALKALRAAAKPETISVRSIIDLEPHHCRWPIGEPVAGFCGARKVHGLPYCTDHAVRAYDLDKLTKATRILICETVAA